VPLEDPVVDARELGQRLDGDWELLRELTEVFAQDYPRLVESLRLALVAADPLLVRIHAHTISGIVANLGAQRAQRVALRLEEIGRTGTLTAEASTIFDLLCGEIDTACRELRRVVREMCAS
jgi:two-component system, sensor histidine kinase and response regulator